MLSVKRLTTAYTDIIKLGSSSSHLSQLLRNFLRISFSLLFCLMFALPSLTAPEHVEAAGTYLLDKTVQWIDGSIEHIQIGSDGYFVLDGVKRKMVGMNLGSGPSYDEEDCYWLPENVARIDKVLTYLEAAGVRIVEFEPESIWHYGGEAGDEYERYSTVLDLVYAHKMFVMPHFVARHQPDACDLSDCDFTMGYCDETDTVGDWASRFADVMATYPNVITIIIGNELNIPYHDYDYQPENVTNYLQFIKGIFNSSLDVPAVCNFAAYSEGDAPVRDDIVSAGLSVTDWPCFTHYGDSLSLYNTRIEILTNWLSSQGYTTNGYWIEETNYCSWSPPDASKFTVEYLESLFDNGASMALLHTTISPDNPGYSFFDTNGDPIQSMAALSTEFTRLQAPLSGSNIPPVVATGEATNITSKSADLVGMVNDLGSASTVAVSFYWGYAPENMDNETSVITVSTTGSFSIGLTDLNPETTYYFKLKAQGDGVSYGETKSFVTDSSVIETPAGPPYVETTDAINITSNSVTLIGTLTDLNGADSVSTAFLIGTSPERPDNEYSSDVLTEAGVFTREISELSPNTTYYYRSKAVGFEIGYGEIQSFTTLQLVDPEVVTGEAVNVSSDSAVLVGDLTNLGTASSNTVSFLWGSSSESLDTETTVEVVNSPGTFTEQISGLVPGTTYYFQTKAVGDTISCGEIESFVTTGQDPPPAPTLISPGNGSAVTGRTITFNWNDYPDATRYWLTVKRQSDNSVLLSRVVYDTTITTSVFSDNGTTYYWVVWAYNGYGWSLASEKWTFTNGSDSVSLLPHPPALISPADGSGISGKAVTFQWEAIENADRYWLTVKKQSDNSLLLGSVVYDNTIAVSVFADDGTTYYWIVWAHNEYGWSEVSENRTFTNGTNTEILTLPAPTPVVPYNGADLEGNTVTFVWNAGDSAIKYWLTVKRQSDNSVVYSQAIYGNTQTVSVFPDDGTNYYWIVWAYNQYGWSPRSAASYFTN